MNRKRFIQVLVALGAGAVGAGVVLAVTKSELEQSLQTSGAELQRRLRVQGTTLSTELRSASERAAVTAVRQEMARLGITDSLVRDTAATVRRLNALAARFT